MSVYGNIKSRNSIKETYKKNPKSIYGLSKLLGHNALSLNAIIANRANGTFSKNPAKTIESLILYTLDRLVR